MDISTLINAFIVEGERAVRLPAEHWGLRQNLFTFNTRSPSPLRGYDFRRLFPVLLAEVMFKEKIASATPCLEGAAASKEMALLKARFLIDGTSSS